jgi:hypothetical protein
VAFLSEFVAIGNVSVSANAIGVPRKTVPALTTGRSRIFLGFTGEESVQRVVPGLVAR